MIEYLRERESKWESELIWPNQIRIEGVLGYPGNGVMYQAMLPY